MTNRTLTVTLIAVLAACHDQAGAGAVAPLDARDAPRRQVASPPGSLPAVDAASASPGADAHGAGGPAPSRVEVGALTDEQIARSVTRVHDATFEVAVALLPQVFADPVTALRGARVIPSSRDGRPAGFKLFAIRPGSLPAALGFRNGDLLVTIAGESLVDASRGLELYARLGALAPGDVIRVGIERGGRPSTLTYRIR